MQARARRSGGMAQVGSRSTAGLKKIARPVPGMRPPGGRAGADAAPRPHRRGMETRIRAFRSGAWRALGEAWRARAGEDRCPRQGIGMRDIVDDAGWRGKVRHAGKHDGCAERAGVAAVVMSGRVGAAPACLIVADMGHHAGDHGCHLDPAGRRGPASPHSGHGEDEHQDGGQPGPQREGPQVSHARNANQPCGAVKIIGRVAGGPS